MLWALLIKSLLEHCVTAWFIKVLKLSKSYSRIMVDHKKMKLPSTLCTFPRWGLTHFASCWLLGVFVLLCNMHYGHKLFISPRKILEVEVCDAGCKGNMLGARLVQPNLFKAGGPAAIGQSTRAEHCGSTVPDHCVWCLEFRNAGRPYSPWSDYKRLDRANHLPRPFYVIILASLLKQDAFTFILLPKLLNNNNNNKSR